MFENLAHAMYELPKKAVSFATIDKLLPKEYEACKESYVDAAKSELNQLSRELNASTQGMPDDKTLQGYALKGGYDGAESYHTLKHYIENTCSSDLSDVKMQLNEKAQKMVEYAREFAEMEGKEIPFTNEPVLDAMILGSMAVGIPLAFKKFARKYTSNLFPNYSKL